MKHRHRVTHTFSLTYLHTDTVSFSGPLGPMMTIGDSCRQNSPFRPNDSVDVGHLLLMLAHHSRLATTRKQVKFLPLTMDFATAPVPI